MTSRNRGFDNNQQENLTLLKVYTVYRVLLCFGLLATFLFSTNIFIIGGLKPNQFFYVTMFYLAVNLVGLVAILPKKTPFNSQQLFANFLFDITFIIAIIDASNGVDSGLGILFVVIIAASSIVLTSQLAVLVAAIASIAVIADTTRLMGSGNLEASAFVSAGLLGIIFFITSLLIQNLAARIRKAQVIADERTSDVLRLQSLNQQIVQRMQTGILVIDQHGNIQLGNAAATEFLTSATSTSAPTNNDLVILPPELMEKFQQWKLTPQLKLAPFRTTQTGRDINANFSVLGSNKGQDTLVFLEDNSRLVQRAQQIKLASLGRLTASIAHEIRNPLSAVSHAAQLLEESDMLNGTDKKLSGIIQNHSKRMDNIIENVLQLSQRTSLNPEKIQLKDWLKNFVTEFEQENSQPFDVAIIDHDQTTDITFDSSQLTQVIANLSHNGLRYSFQNTGAATLTYSIHLNAETSLPVLDVIDEGIGISEAERDHLFEPFYTTETKGTGLGLYISRALCEANEARLDYLRDDDNKSCFRISFPHPDRRLSNE